MGTYHNAQKSHCHVLRSSGNSILMVSYFEGIWKLEKQCRVQVSIPKLPDRTSDMGDI